MRRAETPWLFKRAAEPSISYTFRSDKFLIKDYLDRNPTTGLLIARDDTIGYDTINMRAPMPDRFLSQSMAKTITAMLIGIAVSEGKIGSIYDPVSADVPGLANGGIREDLYSGPAAYVVRRRLYGKLRWQSTTSPSSDAISSVHRVRILSPASLNSTRALFRLEPGGTTPAPRRKSWVWCCAPLSASPLRTIFTTGSGKRSAQRPTHHGPSTAPAKRSPSAVSTRSCGLRADGRLLAHDGAWKDVRSFPGSGWRMPRLCSRLTPISRPRLLRRISATDTRSGFFPARQRRFALLGIRGQIILVDPASKLVMVHTAVRQKPSDPGSYAEILTLWFSVVAQLGK